MRLDQSQIIRQDLRAFSTAVQNLVVGVKSASISWNDQNYQMLFRSKSQPPVQLVVYIGP